MKFRIVNVPTVNATVLRGPTGPAGIISPVAEGTIIGNVSGETAAPVGLAKPAIKTLLNFVEPSELTWASINNKPLVFPPNAHSHPLSDLTGLGTGVASALALASSGIGGIARTTNPLFSNLSSDQISLYDPYNVTYGQLSVVDGDLQLTHPNYGNRSVAYVQSPSLITPYLGDATGWSLSLAGPGTLGLPSGTTAQRVATQGVRWNTTTGRHEFYTGSSWYNHARLTGDTFTGSVVAPSITCPGLLDLRPASTANIIQFAPNGFLRSDTSQLTLYNAGTAANAISFNRGGTTLNLASNYMLGWGSTTQADGGVVQTNLNQPSAGLINIGTTTNNALGSIAALNATLTGRVTFSNDVWAVYSGSQRRIQFGTDGSSYFEASNHVFRNLGATVSATIDTLGNFTTAGVLTTIAGTKNAPSLKLGYSASNTGLYGSASGTTPGLGLSIGGTAFFQTGDSTTGLALHAAWGLVWGSAAADGTIDAGIRRIDANGIQINNGTLGTLRDLSLRSLTASGTIGFSQSRFQQSAAQTLQTQCFDTSLAAWQETMRSQASPTGAKWSVFGATPIVQQTLPAAATDAATTQTLCNAIRSLLLNFGFSN